MARRQDRNGAGARRGSAKDPGEPGLLGGIVETVREYRRTPTYRAPFLLRLACHPADVEVVHGLVPTWIDGKGDFNVDLVANPACARGRVRVSCCSFEGPAVSGE